MSALCTYGKSNVQKQLTASRNQANVHLTQHQYQLHTTFLAATTWATDLQDEYCQTAFF